MTEREKFQPDPHRRGGGRTMTQLRTLRPGDIFVVSNTSMRDHVKSMLGRHRRDLIVGGLKIIIRVAVPGFSYQLVGLNADRKIVVDHACQLEPSVLALIEVHNARRRRV